MFNNTFLKVISITLVLLILCFTPINSFIQVNAYAEGLSMAAIAILKYVIPLIASYLCYNIIGVDYSKTDLAQMIGELEKFRDAIWNLISSYGQLTLYNVVNKVKGMGKDIKELAQDLGIIDSKVISDASTYSDNLVNKINNNLDLEFKDLLDLGILRTTIYSQARLRKDVFYLPPGQGVSRIVQNNSHNFYLNYNPPALGNSIAHLLTDTMTIYKSNTDISGVTQWGKYYYYCIKNDLEFTNNGIRYKLRIDIGADSKLMPATPNAIFEMKLDNLKISNLNYPTGAFMQLDNITANREVKDVNGMEFLEMIGRGGLKKFIDWINPYSATDLTKTKYYIDDTGSVFDYLDIGAYGNFTLSPPLDKSVPLTMPLYGTESICSDEVYEKTQAKDKEKVKADTNVTVNEDGTVGVSGKNFTKDGVPIGDTPPIEIPDIGNPTAPAIPGTDTGNPPGDGTGSATDGTSNWILKIPVLGSILKALQDIWEWLKSLPGLLKAGMITLFVPSAGYFTNYFKMLQTFLSEKFGLLFYPIELLLDLANKFIDSTTKENLVIQMKEPFCITIKDKKYVIMPPFKFDFADMYSKSGFKIIRDIVLMFSDVIIAIGLVNLLQKKYKEVIEK